MRLYSYIVVRDFGFAPNPFCGSCTLATCKPRIRTSAKIGDWILGTGSKPLKRDGCIVYAMEVSETPTYDQYWSDPQFACKRAYFHGSLKQAYGDNIYHRDPATGNWIQEDSHHSHADGTPNLANVLRDTQSAKVLIGREFYYWGATGPSIPVKFRNFNGDDICSPGRGHRCKFPTELVKAFITWIRSLDGKGYMGEPARFRQVRR